MMISVAIDSIPLMSKARRRTAALFIASGERERSFINGAIYVAIVLFLPYGIVGTWRLKSVNMREGWDRLLGIFGAKATKD